MQWRRELICCVMIGPMPSRRSISLDNKILDLHAVDIPRFGQQSARQLALALAEVSPGKDSTAVTISDLLDYLPARYEDRSSMVEIRHLYQEKEASLFLRVKVSGGYEVRNRRSFKQRLYKFEVSAIDQQRTGRQVVVWWFVSGARAQQIISYYARRLVPGARFIAFGKWEWDKQRGTYSLRLNRPDELELVTGADDETGEVETDPTLAAIHVGRRVPIYRKLGEFRTKRLREIIHELLAHLSARAIEETLPSDLLTRRKLIDRNDAVRHAHFPKEDASLEDYHNMRSPAHQRLIFERLFWVAIGLA